MFKNKNKMPTYSYRQAAKYINANATKYHIPTFYTKKMMKQLEEAVRLVPKARRHRYTQTQLDNFMSEVQPR